MQNAGLILVILLAAALAYIRFEQPDTWNQYLQMLKATAPVPAASPDAAPTSTSTGTTTSSNTPTDPAGRQYTQSADGSLHYRGFTIDVYPSVDPATAEKIKTSLLDQVDIVYSVGLPQQILDFFTMVPIKIVPPSGVSSAEPGLYSGEQKEVHVSDDLVTIGHKPVLLHELLHAYHDQRISGGFENPEITDLYENAKRNNSFVLTSHMMSNNREYFACSGTTYLFGVTAQEPFQRAKIQGAQPELIRYFQTVFGPNAGTYVGTL
jgi:hypothetical protein